MLQRPLPAGSGTRTSTWSKMKVRPGSLILLAGLAACAGHSEESADESTKVATDTLVETKQVVDTMVVKKETTVAADTTVRVDTTIVADTSVKADTTVRSTRRRSGRGQGRHHEAAVSRKHGRWASTRPTSPSVLWWQGSGTGPAARSAGSPTGSLSLG